MQVLASRNRHVQLSMAVMVAICFPLGAGDKTCGSSCFATKERGRQTLACVHVCSGTLLTSLLQDVQMHSHKECSVRVVVRMSLRQISFVCFVQLSCLFYWCILLSAVRCVFVVLGLWSRRSLSV